MAQSMPRTPQPRGSPPSTGNRNPPGPLKTAANIGTNPKGYLVLAVSGRYFNINRRADRPKTTERTADGFAANTGSWSVNEADKTLTFHIESAMNTEIEGIDAKSTVTLNGDDLRVTSATSNTTNVYKRVRASN